MSVRKNFSLQSFASIGNGSISASHISAGSISAASFTATVGSGFAPRGTYRAIKEHYEDDLLELAIIASKNLPDVKVIFRKHPAAEKEPDVEKLIGYYPSGEWQILFKKDDKIISCIRGMVSFGRYELFGIENIDTGDPERFDTPKQVVEWLRHQFKSDTPFNRFRKKLGRSFKEINSKDIKNHIKP